MGKQNRNFEELSRLPWIRNDGNENNITDIQLIVGCVQRIANSLECIKDCMKQITYLPRENSILRDKNKTLKRKVRELKRELFLSRQEGANEILSNKK